MNLFDRLMKKRSKDSVESLPAQSEPEPIDVKVQVEEIVKEGVRLKRQGDLAGAKRSYLRAIQLDPTQRMSFWSLAKVCYLLSEQDEAILNYLRAAHLTLPGLAQMIAENPTLRQQLNQVTPDIMAQFTRKHRLAVYLLFDPDTPSHLAHAIVDLNPGFPKSDAGKKYIPVYQSVLAGRGGQLDDRIDQEDYRPIGIQFLLERIQWEKLDDRRVLQIYPEVDLLQRTQPDSAPLLASPQSTAHVDKSVGDVSGPKIYLGPIETSNAVHSTIKREIVSDDAAAQIGIQMILAASEAVNSAYVLGTQRLDLHLPEEDLVFQQRFGGSQDRPVLVGMLDQTGSIVRAMTCHLEMPFFRRFQECVIPLFTSAKRLNQFVEVLTANRYSVPVKSLPNLPFSPEIEQGLREGWAMINPLPEIFMGTFPMLDKASDSLQIVAPHHNDVLAPDILVTAIRVLSEIFPDGNWQIDGTGNAVIGELNTFGRQGTGNFNRRGLKSMAPSLWAAEQQTQLRQFFDNYFSELRDPATEDISWEVAKHRVFPVIKQRLVADDQVQQLVLREWQPAQNLCIYLVVDSSQAMRHVFQSQLDQWKVTADVAFETAMTNLARCTNAVTYDKLTTDSGMIWGYMIKTQDGYDATRVLLPNVRRKLCRLLGETNCVVAIPHRDVLIAFSQRQVLSSIKPFIEEKFQTTRYPLTPNVFVASEDGYLDFPSIIFTEKEENGGAQVFVVSRGAPMSADEHVEQGNIYQYQGLIDEGFQEFKTAVAQAPDSASAHVALGTAYYSRDLLEEARQEYEVALKLDPNHAEAHADLGSIHEHQGNLDSAMLSYRDALQNKPDFLEVRVHLAELYRRRGQVADAAREYESALQVTPSMLEVRSDLAVAYVQLKRFDDAQREFRTVLEQSQTTPALAHAHTGLGVVLEETGRLSEALDEYQQVLNLEPDNANGHYNSGNVLMKLERYEDAIRAYRSALALVPGNPNIHANLASAYWGGGHHQEAIQEFQACLQIAPNDVQARFSLAQLLSEEELWEQAVHEFQEILRYRPDFAEALAGLKEIHEKLEGIDENTRQLKTAITAQFDEVARALAEQQRQQEAQRLAELETQAKRERELAEQRRRQEAQRKAEIEAKAQQERALAEQQRQQEASATGYWFNSLAPKIYQTQNTGRTFSTTVVGVTFEGRQRVVATLSPGEQIVLRREPNNPYDHNAISVEKMNGEQIGHVNRQLAAAIALELDAFDECISGVVTAVTGGYSRSSNLGVDIQFTLPTSSETEYDDDGF